MFPLTLFTVAKCFRDGAVDILGEQGLQLIYRARTFIPAPLSVVQPFWRTFSQLGDAFDPLPGSWDELTKTPDGALLRTIHRPRLRWIYDCKPRPDGPHALTLEVEIRKGASVLARLLSHETLKATGHQTSWDVEWMGEPASHRSGVGWSRMVKRLVREFAAEIEHRDLHMCEAIAQSPWAKEG